MYAQEIVRISNENSYYTFKAYLTFLHYSVEKETTTHLPDSCTCISYTILRMVTDMQFTTYFNFKNIRLIYVRT